MCANCQRLIEEVRQEEFTLWERLCQECGVKDLYHAGKLLRDIESTRHAYKGMAEQYNRGSHVDDCDDPSNVDGVWDAEKWNSYCDKNGYHSCKVQR